MFNLLKYKRNAQLLCRFDLAYPVSRIFVSKGGYMQSQVDDGWIVILSYAYPMPILCGITY